MGVAVCLTIVVVFVAIIALIRGLWSTFVEIRNRRVFCEWLEVGDVFSVEDGDVSPFARDWKYTVEIIDIKNDYVKYVKTYSDGTTKEDDCYKYNFFYRYGEYNKINNKQYEFREI